MNKVLQEEKNIKREVGTLIDENRMINFSDAVFAFAATLLVLKIDLPQLDPVHVQDQFLPAIYTLWPQYLANIISFLIIGYYWLNHHAIFAMIKRFNATIVWLNLLFLVFLSFIPFPVDLYGEYMNVPAVVMFYSASLAVVGYILALLWFYAVWNHRLISKELARSQIWYYALRSLLAPVVFTFSIPLVFVDPVLAQLSWLFVILGILVLNKVFKLRKITKIEEMSL